MIVEVILTDAQVQEIAERAAELLSASAAPTPAGGLVDAQTVADSLGCSRDWVYDHAEQLNGRRIGTGDRPRWRFSIADALAAFEPAGKPTRATPRRRSPNGNGRHLLPVHGQAER